MTKKQLDEESIEFLALQWKRSKEYVLTKIDCCARFRMMVKKRIKELEKEYAEAD